MKRSLFITFALFFFFSGYSQDFFNTEFVEEMRWGDGTITGYNCQEINIELIPNAEFELLDYHTLNYDHVRLTEPAAPCPSP